MDIDYGSYFQSLFALIFVLGLIGALALVAKRLGLANSVPNLGKKAKRLSVVESISIYGRHRAVLVRRDDVEHLVIISPNSEVVIETGISAPPPTLDDQAKNTDGSST